MFPHVLYLVLHVPACSRPPVLYELPSFLLILQVVPSHVVQVVQVGIGIEYL